MKNLFLLTCILTMFSCNNQQQHSTQQEEPSRKDNGASKFALGAIDDLSKFKASRKTAHDSLRLEDALINAEKSITLDPKSFRNRFVKRNILFVLKRYDEALATLKDFKKQTKDSTELTFSEGLVYDLTGQKALAQKKYLETIHLYDIQLNDKHKTRFTVNRIFLYLLTNNNEMAKAELEKLHKQHPKAQIINYFLQLKTITITNDWFLDALPWSYL